MSSDFAIVIEKKPVKNFWKGRGGFLPIAIVEKMMQGTIEDAEQYFNGRSPEGVFAVSAHYGIARNGRVWQFVEDEDTAWSNGVLQNPDLSIGWLKEVYQEKVNCNLVTLSIDYEGYSGEPLTPRQYEAAVALHRQLIQRWEIEADSQHVIGQNWIDSRDRHHNPGPLFPFNQLIKDLNSPAVPAAPPQPVAPNPLAFLETPMSETDGEVTPPTAEPENVAAYQPETAEEPAYRPQVENFTFTPDLNEEVDQVTAIPTEVESATAEPEPVQTETFQDTADYQPEVIEQDKVYQPEEVLSAAEPQPEAFYQPETAEDSAPAYQPQEFHTEAAYQPEEIQPFSELVPEAPPSEEAQAAQPEEASPETPYESAETYLPAEEHPDAGIPLTEGEHQVEFVPIEVESQPEETPSESAYEASEHLEEVQANETQPEDAPTDGETEAAFEPPVVSAAPEQSEVESAFQPDEAHEEAAPIDDVPTTPSVEEPGEHAAEPVETTEAAYEAAPALVETERNHEEAPSAGLAQIADTDEPETVGAVEGSSETPYQLEESQPEEVSPPEAVEAQPQDSFEAVEAAAPTGETAPVEESQPETASPVEEETAAEPASQSEEAAAEPAPEPEPAPAVTQPADFDLDDIMADLAYTPKSARTTSRQTRPAPAPVQPEAAVEAVEPEAVQAEPASEVQPESQPEDLSEVEPTAAPEPIEPLTEEASAEQLAEDVAPAGEQEASIENPADQGHEDWAADVFADEPFPAFENEAATATEEAAAPVEAEVSPPIGDDITPKYFRPEFFDPTHTVEPTPLEVATEVEEPTTSAAAETLESVETTTPETVEAATEVTAPEAVIEQFVPTAEPETAAPVAEETTPEAEVVSEAATEPAPVAETAPVPEVNTAAPAQEAESERNEEKHHWYDGIKKLFGGHEERPAQAETAPIPLPSQAPAVIQGIPYNQVAATATEEAAVESLPVETGPVLAQEAPEVYSNTVQAYQPEYSAEQEVTQDDTDAPSGSVEAATEPNQSANQFALPVEVAQEVPVEAAQEAPAEPVAAEQVAPATASEQAALPVEPAVEPSDAPAAIQEVPTEPPTPEQIAFTAEPTNAFIAEPEQALSSAIEEVPTAPPAPEQTAPETEPEQTAFSVESTGAPTTESEVTQEAPAEAEVATEPGWQPGPAAEETPVNPPVETPKVEETFYPFELDVPGTPNYGNYYQSAEPVEPPVQPSNYDFNRAASTYSQEYGSTGPSDYPFELPTQETPPSYLQSHAPSDSAQPVEVAPPPAPARPEPAQPAEAAQIVEPEQAAEPAPPVEPEPNIPPFSFEPERPGDAFFDSNAIGGDHPKFAYDDLELPSWLNEPESFEPEAAQPSQSAAPAAPSAPQGNDFAWAIGSNNQEGALPGWLQESNETPSFPDWLSDATAPVEGAPANSPVAPAPTSSNKDAPAVEIPNKDWQENENLFEDDDFFSLLNQSGLDLSLERGGTGTLPSTGLTPPEPAAPSSAATPVQPAPAPAPSPVVPPVVPTQVTPPPAPAEPKFESYFDEVVQTPPPPPAKITVRQLIDRNDGYTAPLSYEDLDMSVPFGLEEDVTAPPTPPAPPVTPARQDPPGFRRSDLGGGMTSVELANIRSIPSYDKNTVVRVTEQGERFTFDGWIEGPELRGSTRWYRIASNSGDIWIHSTLVQLDRPFRG